MRIAPTFAPVGKSFGVLLVLPATKNAVVLRRASSFDHDKIGTTRETKR